MRDRRLRDVKTMPHRVCGRQQQLRCMVLLALCLECQGRQPTFAVVIVLLKATALWDRRAVVYPPPEPLSSPREGTDSWLLPLAPCCVGKGFCTQSAPPGREVRIAGRMTASPEPGLRRKLGKIKHASLAPGPWQGVTFTMGIPCCPPLPVLCGIRNLNSGIVSQS